MKRINAGAWVKTVAACAFAAMSLILTSCENSEDGSQMSFVPTTKTTETVEMWDTTKDALDASKKINDTTEEFAPTWVKFENGEEVSRETFHAVAPRILEVLTSWKVEASSYSQVTEKVTKVSQTSKDTIFYSQENPQVRFEGKRVETIWESTVTVDSKIVEYNRWRTVEVNGVIVTYKGKSLDLGNDAEEASNSASVTESGVYGDTLTYVFGDNTKTCVAPGQIVLTKPEEPEPDTFFPKEWGKLLAVKQANTKGQSSKTSINSWSLHFEKGTLPVMLEGDSPVWAFENFEEGNLDERLNSGYYVNGKVVNTIAEDKSFQMSWRTSDEVVQGNRAYEGLDKWNSGKGWDDGNKVDGHYSVHNEHHSFTLDNSGKVGVLKIRDVRHNKTVGEFTYTLK